MAVAILENSLGEEEHYVEDGFGRSWWSQHRATKQFQLQVMEVMLAVFTRRKRLVGCCRSQQLSYSGHYQRECGGF